MSTYTSQFLRVNLTTGAIRAEPIPEQVKRDFVGGRGLGIKYLYDELAPGLEPLRQDGQSAAAEPPRRRGEGDHRDAVAVQQPVPHRGRTDRLQGSADAPPEFG